MSFGTEKVMGTYRVNQYRDLSCLLMSHLQAIEDCRSGREIIGVSLEPKCEIYFFIHIGLILLLLWSHPT